jgi:PleD family two-component response regulator
MDLSRSLESLRRTAELADRTRTLTALVAQRTRELELEAQTRRRAEAELQTLNDELRVRLHLDGLTGICNRVGFDERLFSEWTSHSHSGAALSLLMVDVDHFKLYNDGYGHLAGDECLRAIAQCRTTLRHATGARSSPSSCPTPTPPEPSCSPARCRPSSPGPG